jgi:hypothetical protein
MKFESGEREELKAVAGVVAVFSHRLTEGKMPVWLIGRDYGFQCFPVY